MFRLPGEYEENKGDAALRLGLRSLPVPETSSDFDARVHAALRLPTSWRRTFWTHARPVFSTAGASLLVTLALLKGLAAAASGSQSLSQPAGAGVVVAYGTRDLMDALDSGNLPAESLRGFPILRRPLPVKPSRTKEPPRPAVSETHS